MKIRILITTAALVMAISSTANAGGIPVIDVSNLAQSIQQVTHMVEQISQLQAQLDKAQETLDSMSGARGFGSGFKGGTYDTALDGSKYTEILDQYSMKEASALKLGSSSSEFFENGNKNAATYLTKSMDAITQATTRFEELQGLIGGIDSAPDQKAILDLQARISGEQALLENERIKLAAIKAEATAQQQMQKQKERQMRVEFSKPADY